MQLLCDYWISIIVIRLSKAGLARPGALCFMPDTMRCDAPVLCFFLGGVEPLSLLVENPRLISSIHSDSV